MTNKKQPLKYKLDAYEQDLYDNFGKGVSIMTDELKAQIKEAATQNIESRQPITIRVLKRDLSAIRIKAARRALPYQTYINMLLHQDAMSA